jgi:hypothetical protein
MPVKNAKATAKPQRDLKATIRDMSMQDGVSLVAVSRVLREPDSVSVVAGHP